MAHHHCSHLLDQRHKEEYLPRLENAFNASQQLRTQLVALKQDVSVRVHRVLVSVAAIQQRDIADMLSRIKGYKKACRVLDKDVHQLIACGKMPGAHAAALAEIVRRRAYRARRVAAWDRQARAWEEQHTKEHATRDEFLRRHGRYLTGTVLGYLDEGRTLPPLNLQLPVFLSFDEDLPDIDSAVLVVSGGDGGEEKSSGSSAEGGVGSASSSDDGGAGAFSGLGGLGQSEEPSGGSATSSNDAAGGVASDAGADLRYKNIELQAQVASLLALCLDHGIDAAGTSLLSHDGASLVAAATVTADTSGGGPSLAGGSLSGGGGGAVDAAAAAAVAVTPIAPVAPVVAASQTVSESQESQTDDSGNGGRVERISTLESEVQRLNGIVGVCRGGFHQIERQCESVQQSEEDAGKEEAEAKEGKAGGEKAGQGAGQGNTSLMSESMSGSMELVEHAQHKVARVVRQAQVVPSLRERVDSLTLQQSQQQERPDRDSVIVFTAFQHDDVALFMPITRKGGRETDTAPNYVAFHRKQPRHFLTPESVELFWSVDKLKKSKGGESCPPPAFILGKICMVQECLAEEGNRFDLEVGKKYYLVDVGVVKQAT